MSDILAEYESLINNPAPLVADMAALGGRLKYAGFKAQSDRCFEGCVRTLQKFIADGNLEAALRVEQLLYNPMLKTTETEEHYYQCFRQWSPQLQTLGRMRQRPLRQDRNPRKICFTMHNGVLLGHTEVMFRVIDSWLAQGIECELYLATIHGANDSFKALVEQRGIKLIGPVGLERGAAAQNLRELFEAADIATVVWLSIPTLASYALAMKLAPRQVFWSVKFHPLWIPEVDVHLCGGQAFETTRNYNGRDWTVSPFPLTLTPKGNDPAKVKRIREAFPADAILLGALAREEKFNSPAYLDTIGTLLARNPRAYFLWTGRHQPEVVLAAFRKHGVLDRCRFIGWVDTNLVAEALDVFLETFPFGCGITGFQSMSHGTPLLSYDSPDTLYGYQLQVGVEQQFAGGAVPKAQLETLDILTAADPEHYLQLAQKLIDDVAYRREIGAREQAYFQGEQEALPRYTKRLWTNISGLPA